jgi:hypothetical protein
MQEFQLTESQVVNEWMEKGACLARRECLLIVLDERFPGAVSEQERAVIETENSANRLREWFRISIRVAAFDEFRAALNT